MPGGRVRKRRRLRGGEVDGYRQPLSRDYPFLPDRAANNGRENLGSCDNSIRHCRMRIPPFPGWSSATPFLFHLRLVPLPKSFGRIRVYRVDEVRPRTKGFDKWLARKKIRVDTSCSRRCARERKRDRGRRIEEDRRGRGGKRRKERWWRRKRKGREKAVGSFPWSTEM